MKKTTKGILFLVTLVALFLLCDIALRTTRPVSHSQLFYKNDYEKTIDAHGGETVYDKVFFGNSVVISGYIEEESDSGFINFGMDYGKVTDVLQMLKKGYLQVEELVLGLNYFTLMDTLDTNPTYPWHQKLVEPYAYFERDRLYPLIENCVNAILYNGSFEPERYTDLNKSVYYGEMTPDQLKEKIAVHSEKFWGLGEDNYLENLAALRQLCYYCREKGIELRVVWMPWSDYVPMPENPKRIREFADQILTEEGIDVLDMENSLEPNCFHDLAHLNYEHGAHVFTKEIDKWLIR